jgi:hypothetical protein
MSLQDVTQASREGNLGALRELLLEMVEQVKPTEPVQTVITYRTDISAMSCKALVARIIAARGEQAAAVLATKLNAELARRGKARVKLSRPTRNGNGNGAGYRPRSLRCRPDS